MRILCPRLPHLRELLKVTDAPVDLLVCFHVVQPHALKHSLLWLLYTAVKSMCALFKRTWLLKVMRDITLFGFIRVTFKTHTKSIPFVTCPWLCAPILTCLNVDLDTHQLNLCSALYSALWNIKIGHWVVWITLKLFSFDASASFISRACGTTN